MGIEVHYLKGQQLWASTINATIFPRVGDTVYLGGVEVKVTDVIWHIETNKTWVDILIQPSEYYRPKRGL